MDDARLCVITGAAGAIGGALAHALALRAPAAHLALVDVDGAGLDRLAGELGPRASTHRWDLADPEGLPARWEALTEGRGAVDLLVNCAGIMELRSVAGTPWPLARRLLDIDLVSPLRLMALAAPGMAARRRGWIVNVSSMAGRVPLRGAAYYGAAKAGLAMASEIARLELAPAGVRVVTVYPGPVASALEQGARAQLRPSRIARLMPTGDATAIAAAVVRALDRHRPRVVYPALYAAADRAIGVASWVTRRWSPEPAA